MDNRRQSEAGAQKESSPELELELSEEEPDETEEQKAERVARRLKREVDLMQLKLKKLKEKEVATKSERRSMRAAIKKNQQLLK
jgi:thiamine monophosphate synthase